MAIYQRNIAVAVSGAIEKSKLQKTHVANRLGIPLAQLSRYLSGSRPFDLKVLDGITNLLGLPKGHFYDEYLNDCWDAPRNRSSRIRNFLCHTTMNGLDKYTKKMIDQLLDSGRELCDLYYAGEQLDQKGMYEAALRFYDLVIDNERNRLSESLALSYYRRFMIVRNWDMEHAFEAATKLGEHIRALPGKVMYEAYVNILTVFYVLDKWDHLLKYSEEVSSVMEAAREYDLFLYAKCLSYLGISYRHKKQFDKAIEIIRRYASLPEEKYKVWAELNTCVVLLESGQSDRVYDLIKLAQRYREEAPNHIEHILGAFLKQKKFDEMEWALSLFADDVEALFAMKDPLSKKRAIRVRCFIAKLYMHQGRHDEAARIIASSLSIARKLRLTNQVNECLRIVVQNAVHISKRDMEMICEAI
jgi:tetratricopeptide (TPR) repeat protein